MKSYRKIVSLLLTGALFVGAVGCGTGASANTNSSAKTDSSSEGKELKTVRIGSPGNDDYPLLESLKLALDKGYLEEELNAVGYTFEYTPFQEAGPAINEAYASKALDVAIYGELPALTAFSNGVDTRVFGIADNQMNAGVIVAPNSGINTPKDLEGKKVIVGIGTNYHEYWQHLIEDEGIDPNKVEIVNVVSDAASVFTTGEADAWITLYYNDIYYQNQGVAVDIANSVDNPDHAGLWLATGRQEYLAENPDVPVAILKAMKRSQEYTVQHPDEFFEAIASPTLGLDVFKEAYSFDDTFSFLNYDIDSKVIEKLEYTAGFLKSNGFVSGDIDINAFIDRSYIEKLN